jgi:U1 zinc finger protein
MSNPSRSVLSFLFPTKLSLTCLLVTGDYCDVYLTHDSMSVRKAHNAGRNHLRNVVEYYQRMVLYFYRLWAL